MTEAAQANRGGLERSSYTWQGRRHLYVVRRPKCQRKPRRIYLAEWREHRGLTQKQLGERLDPPKTDMAVSRWERGERRLNTSTIDQVCYALDIEPMDLYRDPKRPSADELLRGLPEAAQRQAIAVIEAIKKTGTGG